MKDGDRQAERLSRNSREAPHQHGGARAGAGRPRKYDLEEIVDIGYACEKLWCEASDAAVTARYASLKNASEIQLLRDGAPHNDLDKRKTWFESERYWDVYKGDLEALLHERAGTPFDDISAEFESDAPRIVTISTKPPRGTRKRIIETVATESGLSENTVDNLWQAFRRFKQNPRNSSET